MKVIDDSTTGSVRARVFETSNEDGVIPGVLWTPASATGARPKVLLGHGGTQDKFAPNIVALAEALVSQLDFACVAIDAPGHGDRVTAEEREAFRQAVTRIDPRVPRDRGATSGPYSAMFVRGARDWKIVLDEVETLSDVGHGPSGWWGVSMGVSIGLPFVADEPRIECAVLGLASTVPRPGHAEYLGWARRFDRPLLFLCQRDDGGHPIENALELFDLFGSRQKTMHINPGPHIGVPAFEREASVAFFARHLVPWTPPPKADGADTPARRLVRG